MNKYDLSFILNSTDKIVIKLEEPLTQVHCCYMTDTILLHVQQKILLSSEPLFFNMKDLSSILQKALRNELQLHESINQDIGYLLNEYYQCKEGFVMHNFSEESSSWVGYLYHLWEGSKKNIRYVTWIYNNRAGEIVLEVTPSYPYFFCDPEDEPNYISYQEWIKNYRPYLITTISNETAQKWLLQAHEIINQIQANIQRWETEEQSEEK